MQRDEMRTLIRDIARIGTHDVTDANLDTFLDEGYGEVVTNRNWPWGYSLTPQTITMISGTDEYVLNSAVKQVLAVVEVDQRYALEAISQSEWARTKERINSTSRPQRFVFTRGTLHLFPVPGNTDDLDVYYYEHPAFAAADASEPVFHDSFHTILVDWGLSRMWEQEEDFDKAESYRARFEIKMERMGKFYNDEVLDRPMIYGDRPSVSKGRFPNMPWLGDAAVGGAA